MNDDAYPSREGCYALLTAMWSQVRRELEHGNRATVFWLTTDGFDRWARVSFARLTPEAVRRELLGAFGQRQPGHPNYRPELPKERMRR